MNKQCVLVEMDALLDTRLAVLASLDQEAAVKALASPEYYGRQIDDFSALTGVSREAFKDAYTKRDVEMLKRSIMTMVPLMLNELIGKLEQDEAESPYVDSVEVEVNVWPYELDHDELDGLQKAIMAYSGVETPVRMVRTHPMELTPAFIKAQYTGMILYNFRDWFEYHKDAFATTKAPGLIILAPALWGEKIPTPEEYLTEGVNPDISPFLLAEVALLDCFQLQLLQPAIFSIRHPGTI